MNRGKGYSRENQSRLYKVYMLNTIIIQRNLKEFLNSGLLTINFLLKSIKRKQLNIRNYQMKLDLANKYLIIF